MRTILLSWKNLKTRYKLIEVSQIIGLAINKDKIKYIITTSRLINIQNINIGQYTFEQVNNFKYLGVNINTNNNMHNEINLRIAAANRGYFVISKRCSSQE